MQPKILIVFSIFLLPFIVLSQANKTTVSPVQKLTPIKELNSVYDRGLKKYGYINTHGELVISCRYDKASDYFENGLATVKMNGKWGSINKQGEIITPCIFDDEVYFNEEFAIIKKDGKKGYINKAGEIIIPCIYEYAYGFSGGLACVGNNEGKSGYINKKGELVIPYKFDNAWDFHEGLAKVKLNDKIGYINTKGTLVILCKFGTGGNTNEGDFNGGLARVDVDGKFGYINKTGVIVIPAKFDDAFQFKENMAKVYQDGKYGFIDAKGILIIPCKYDDAYKFQEDIALVKVNGGWRFINKKGEEITGDKYAYASNFIDGLADVSISKDSEPVYINKSGEVIQAVSFGDVYTQTSSFTIADGYTYSGRLKNGIPDGQGKWTKTDGSWYEGQFKDGQENGQGTLRMIDGKRYYGVFKDGVPNGVFQVKEWTLGGLMSNEWYAEYNMGQLVSSHKTKDDFDKFLNASSTNTSTYQNSSSNSNTQSANSEIIKEVVIEIKKKNACASGCSESYLFDIYIDGKKKNWPDEACIAKRVNGEWRTDCPGDVSGTTYICDGGDFQNAVKKYFALRYKGTPQKFTITGN